MAYKFQLGDARLSGSVIQEGEVEASSSNGLSVQGSAAGGKVVKVDVTNSNKDGRIRLFQSGSMSTASVQIGSDPSGGEVFLRSGSGVDNISLRAAGGGVATIMGSIELGHASDTTLSRAAAGKLQIQANEVYMQNGTDVAIADGGTGAGNASDARTNLGLAIGSDVQAFDAQLADIAGLATTNGGFIVGNGSNFVLETGATARASLGIGSAGLVASSSFAQVANNLNDLASAATARTNLGVAIGSDVQAHNDILDDIAGVTQAANKGVFFDTNSTAATFDLTAAGRALLDDANAAAQRTTLGLGTGDDVTFTSGSFTGDLSITGDLTVLGGVVSASVTELLVEDRLIRIGDGLADLANAAASGSGFEVGNNLASFKMASGSAIGHHFVSSLPLSSSILEIGDMIVTPDWMISSASISGNLPITASAFVGNASTATRLLNTRTIGGVSFDGTADINLPGVNQAGNQNTSGNAATATKLAAAVQVGGVNFDGSSPIDPTDLDLADLNTVNSEHRLLMAPNNGVQTVGVDAGLTYNPSSNILKTATISASVGFSGDGSGLTGIAADQTRGISVVNYSTASATPIDLNGVAGFYGPVTTDGTSANAITLDLSGTWSDGDLVVVKAYTNVVANSRPLTIRAVGAGTRIDGAATVILESDSAAVSLIRNGSQWSIF